MRIAFLFDNSLKSPETLDLIAYAWINGLAEGAHEIKVVTRRDHAPPAELTSGRVTWAQAVNSWSWLELPKLVQSLASFRPQLIHAILCRKPTRVEMWPLASMLEAWRIPFFVSTNDDVSGPERWPFVRRFVGPRAGALTLPPLISTSVPQTVARDADIFVPGPLKAHQDWRRSLHQIIAEIRNRPESIWSVGWDWSEIALPERFAWRDRLATLPPGRLTTLGALTPSEQARWTLNAREPRLEFLDSASWTAQWLEQCLKPMSSKPLDTAINELNRLYQT